MYRRLNNVLGSNNLKEDPKSRDSEANVTTNKSQLEEECPTIGPLTLTIRVAPAPSPTVFVGR
jgi:hypothetical protein